MQKPILYYGKKFTNARSLLSIGLLSSGSTVNISRSVFQLFKHWINPTSDKDKFQLRYGKKNNQNRADYLNKYLNCRLSTCGGSVTQNCTYIQNPGYPTTYSTTGSCAWSVTPINSGIDFSCPFYFKNFHNFCSIPEICQLRLDFDNFDITDASTGICTDSLTVAGPTGRNPMDLCGTNTDMHRK